MIVFPRAGRALRWPFTNPLAAPLWLALRLYLGTVWLQFGIGKLQGGWLGGNTMHDLLSAIARGHTATPLPAYRHVAQALLEAGADRWLSAAIPLLEIAVALALFGGVLLVPAVIGATLLNLNFVLSGMATWQFDGRIVALQLLLLLAWRVADRLGVGRLRKASPVGSGARVGHSAKASISAASVT